MILAADEIAGLVAHMRRAGVAEVEIADGQDSLRLALPEEAAPTEVAGAASSIVRATACGLFQPGHPARDAAYGAGRRVEAGEVVGVIAVGPLLRPVVAPVAGRLGALLCAPGQRVDYGTALFQLVPATFPQDPSPSHPRKRKDTR